MMRGLTIQALFDWQLPTNESKCLPIATVTGRSKRNIRNENNV